MKVTSFRDVEIYIYSSVIMYLKGLNAPDLAFPSPIKGENGLDWQFGVSPEPIHREFRRNYQREQAQERANLQVTLFTGNQDYVVATYNPKQKWVKIYERPFRVLKAVPLMGKLYEAFYTNAPFGKIITQLEAPRPQQFRHRRNRRGGSIGVPMEAPYIDEPDSDDYEGYGGDDL